MSPKKKSPRGGELRLVYPKGMDCRPWRSGSDPTGKWDDVCMKAKHGIQGAKLNKSKYVGLGSQWGIEKDRPGGNLSLEGTVG